MLPPAQEDRMQPVPIPGGHLDVEEGQLFSVLLHGGALRHRLTHTSTIV